MRSQSPLPSVGLRLSLGLNPSVTLSALAWGEGGGEALSKGEFEVFFSWLIIALRQASPTQEREENGEVRCEEKVERWTSEMLTTESNYEH